MILEHHISFSLIVSIFPTDTCSVMLQAIALPLCPLRLHFMIHRSSKGTLSAFRVSTQLICIHIGRITSIYIYTYIQRYFLRFPLTASNRLGTFSKENTLPPSFLLSLPARNSRASDDLELFPFSIYLTCSSPVMVSPYLSSSSARVCSRDGRCAID